MIKPILLAILIIFLSLVFSPIANATGEVTLGGKIDDGDLSIVTSVDHSWQGKRFINDVEFDYRYKDSNNVKKTNRGLIAFKQRYELQSRHYLFSLLRFDYNEFRSINSRIQSTYGWGYKIFKTEKLKMSNEIATGLLYTNNGNELIFRNSLWISYDVAPKIKFTNKFLYEVTTPEYIRNETSFDYLLTDTVKIGLKNIYVEDPVSDNILSFNIGYVW